MSAKIQTKNIPAIKVACVSHLGNYKDIRFANQQLAGWIKKHGIRPRGKLFNLYYDNPKETPVGNLRSAACIEVDDTVTSSEESVQIQTLSGHLFTSCIAVNEPGKDMSADYMKIFKWNKENGYFFNSRVPAREICLSMQGNRREIEILLPVDKVAA